MITTKSGDTGISKWGVSDNKEFVSVSKDDILLETIGTLDEVQAITQLIRSQFSDLSLEDVSADLWGIMGEIAYDKKYQNLEERVDRMEHTVDQLEEELPKLDKFVIFREDKAVKLNWLRTVVRRAERRMVALSKKKSLNPRLLAYINRLSDYLFMLARQQENQ